MEKAGLKILLDPAYAGKIAWFDPRIGGPGSNDALMVYKTLGPDDTRKVIVDQKSIFYQNTGQGTEAMVRGSALITLGVRVDKESQPYEKAGPQV